MNNSPYQQQMRFHKIANDIPGLKERLKTITTNSGYHGLAISVLPLEIKMLLNIYKNNNVDVQVVTHEGIEVIHMIQGISKSEVSALLDN